MENLNAVGSPLEWVIVLILALPRIIQSLVWVLRFIAPLTKSFKGDDELVAKLDAVKKQHEADKKKANA